LGVGIYTAALVGSVLVIVTLAIPLPYKRQWLASSLFGIIAIIRTTSLLDYASQTSVATYQQEVQAARFVHRYYYRAGISLNEAGAISYFSEGRKVDLTGIATYSFFRGEKRVLLSPVTSDSISWWEGAHLAILSGPRSGSRPAGHWGKVASWSNPPNNIYFYALDTFAGRQLKEQMREYERLLPARIQVKYY
jgi:hypothetical protein